MGPVTTDLWAFENGLNFLGLNLPATSSDPIKDFWKLWWHSLTFLCLAAVLSPENSQVPWKLIPLHLKFLCHKIPKPPSVCQQFQVLVVLGLMKFRHTHSHSCGHSLAKTVTGSGLDGTLFFSLGPSALEPPQPQLLALLWHFWRLEIRSAGRKSMTFTWNVVLVENG